MAIGLREASAAGLIVLPWVAMENAESSVASRDGTLVMLLSFSLGILGRFSLLELPVVYREIPLSGGVIPF